MYGGDPQWMSQYATPEMYGQDQMYQGLWDQFVPPQQENYQQGGYDQQFIPENNEMYYPPQSDMVYPSMQHNQMQLNPIDFNTDIPFARFYVIKSYSEDDIHKSIKYNVWSSTKEGNNKLNKAFQEVQNQYPIYLFFSVNASGQFVGVAEMKSIVDYTKSFGDWAQQGKWMGQFDVQWIFVKDIPNKEFRGIILEQVFLYRNNEGKPVTNSRDTQEVPLKQGIQMLNIFRSYKNRTSILDDFDFYDKRQVEMDQNKQMMPQDGMQQPTEDLLTAQIKKAQLNPNSTEFHSKATQKQKQQEQSQTSKS